MPRVRRVRRVRRGRGQEEEGPPERLKRSFGFCSLIPVCSIHHRSLRLFIHRRRAATHHHHRPLPMFLWRVVLLPRRGRMV